MAFDVGSYYKNHTIQYTMSAYYVLHPRCFMEGQTEQPEQIWRALCQQAVIGNDLDKPIQLSKEINRPLAER